MYCTSGNDTSISDTFDAEPLTCVSDTTRVISVVIPGPLDRKGKNTDNVNLDTLFSRVASACGNSKILGWQ